MVRCSTLSTNHLRQGGITTDPWGNIFIADLENMFIHLLDQDGNFVRYITCGGSLDKIIDVSCDENGRVWVAERDTAKIKCIKYQREK